MEEKRMFQIKRGKYRGIIGIKSTDEIKFDLYHISGVYPKEEEMVYILKEYYFNSFYQDYWKENNKKHDYKVVMEDIAEGKVLQREYVFEDFPLITKVAEFHISQYGNVTKLKTKNLTALFHALDFNKELSKNNYGDYPEIKELTIQNGSDGWESPEVTASDIGLYEQTKEYKYHGGLKYNLHTFEKKVKGKSKRYGYIEIPKEEFPKYKELFLTPYLPYEDIKEKGLVEILLRDTIRDYIYEHPEKHEEDNLLKHFINHYKNEDCQLFLSTWFNIMRYLNYEEPRTECIQIDTEYELKEMVKEFDRVVLIMLYLTGYKQEETEEEETVVIIDCDDEE